MNRLIDLILALLTIAQLLFLTLKLAQVGLVADWSWRWVSAPTWGGMILFAMAITVALCVGFFKRFNRWRASRRALQREMKGEDY